MTRVGGSSLRTRGADVSQARNKVTIGEFPSAEAMPPEVQQGIRSEIFDLIDRKGGVEFFHSVGVENGARIGVVSDTRSNLMNIVVREFGSMENAWANFILSRIEQAAQREFSEYSEEGATSFLPQLRRDGEIGIESVPDISRDDRLFSAPNIVPSRLSLANSHIFYGDVLRNEWYEALPLTDLSTEGRHSIVYQTVEGGFPKLIASMRTQKIRENGDKNLFSAKYFRTPEWQICAGRREIEEAFNDVDKQCENAGSVRNFNAVPDNPTSNRALEESIIFSVGAERMSEYLRLIIGHVLITPGALIVGLGVAHQNRHPNNVASMITMPGSFLKAFRRLEKETGKRFILPLSYLPKTETRPDVYKMLCFPSDDNEKLFCKLT